MSTHKKRYAGGDPQDPRNHWRWYRSGAIAEKWVESYRPERRSLWLGQIVSWYCTGRGPSPLAVVIGILDSGQNYRLRYLDPLAPGEVVSSNREILPASLPDLFDPRRHYRFKFMGQKSKYPPENDYFLCGPVELNQDVPHQLGSCLTAYQPELGEFVLMISSDRFLLGQVDWIHENGEVSLLQFDKERKPLGALDRPGKVIKMSPANLAPISMEDLERNFAEEIALRDNFHLLIEPTECGNGSKCGPSPAMRRPFTRSKRSSCQLSGSRL